MSGPIKKGDLVMIVSPFCACEKSHKTVGRVFSAAYVAQSVCRCSVCGQRQAGTVVATGKRNKKGRRVGYMRAQLIKIDPPATGEYDGVPVRKSQPSKVSA